MLLSCTLQNTHFIKNLYLIIAILISAISNAQIVNIPDANFKNALVNTLCVDTNGDGIADSNADTNNDGEIQVSEAEAVLWLNVEEQSIFSLEGIQSFTNIQVLNCNWNQITSLNVTQNLGLESLEFKGNHSMTSIDITQNLNLLLLNCNYTQLTSLDLSQNPNLKSLSIQSLGITSLDVTQNPNLEVLDCGFNDLSSLNLTQNQNLVTLVCFYNQLNSLDVSQNPNLEELHCSNNLLVGLNVTQNPNLKMLDCTHNQLTSLNVTQNPNLEELRFSNNQLTNLDVSQNSNIKVLNCADNQLTSLDISQNPKFETFVALRNQLTSLNIKNGNNYNLSIMRADYNPNLACIEVDDVNYANNRNCEDDYWCKDGRASYSEDCSLDVQDFSQLNFIIYPNPVKDVLSVNAQESIGNLKIYSITGKLIKETLETSINVSELASGIYFVVVSIDGRNDTKKFIKI